MSVALFAQLDDWYADAACKRANVPIDYFFPELGEKYSEEVKTLCDSCPVRYECREYAVEGNLEDGYWWSTPRERREIRSERRTITSVRIVLLPTQ